jgi:hypothetical protein
MIEDIGHHFLIGQLCARAANYLIHPQLNTLLSLAYGIGVTVKIFSNARDGRSDGKPIRTAYRPCQRDL